MLTGRNSVRVVVLAALVLAVAFSSTVGSHLSLGPLPAAAKPTAAHATEQQRRNSAWQVQLSNEQSRLQQAQQQQAGQQTAGGPTTLTPSTSASGAAGGQVGGSVQAIIEAAFAPLGATAQQWGLCIAQHESGDNPNAVQPGAGGAEGLFQFEPGTWLTTPQGAAGDSVFDATANSEAAAWEYSRGNYNAWTTNAAFCSQYD